MNPYLLWGLIGFGSGIIVFPIILGIYVLFRNTMERRSIKKLMKKGKFLTPIDPKDYDYSVWDNARYGNIDRSETKKDLAKLNEKIFKKPIDEDKQKEIKEKEDFFIKISDYITQMKDLGYSNEEIIRQFKEKQYSDDLIRQIFDYIKGGEWKI